MTRPDVTLHSFSQSLSALKPRGLLLLPIAFLAFALCASAQITNVTNSTSTPIPGAGHDYIKMLSETVEPCEWLGQHSYLRHPRLRDAGFHCPFPLHMTRMALRTLPPIA